MLLDMINSSFLNMPLVQDQQGIDVRSPLPVDDAISMCIDADLKKRMQADQAIYRSFPTQAMYNRYINFRQMDVETLFFAFYYQKGTYQQFLAAQELKRRGWEFHMRFLTWMKKDTSETTGGKGKNSKQSQ